jgi:hypothetical protein
MKRANSGSFKPGMEPWNKGVSGLRMSPATEFKPGQSAHNHVPVGTVKVRQRKNRHDLPRAWVKIAEPNVWQLRAIVEWELAHGPLLPGTIVHHRDRDSMNDASGNLEALTRAEHIAVHAAELRMKRLNAAREQLEFAS